MVLWQNRPAARTEQSPVDIPSSAALNPGGITFDYQEMPLAMLNNGHTIQVIPPAGSTLSVGGKTYNLDQYHFHMPSETELNGAPTAMETHFVHESDDGEFAVVAVMMQPGAENTGFAPIFSNLPASEQPATPVDGVTVDAGALLPAEQSFYRFDGSLTTPPCTEGLAWHVLNTPVELSQAQLDAFKAIFEMNARPVQPLNGRAFELVTTIPATGMEVNALNGILVGSGILVLAGGVGLLIYCRRRVAA